MACQKLFQGRDFDRSSLQSARQTGIMDDLSVPGVDAVVRKEASWGQQMIADAQSMGWAVHRWISGNDHLQHPLPSTCPRRRRLYRLRQRSQRSRDQHGAPSRSSRSPPCERAHPRRTRTCLPRSRVTGPRNSTGTAARICRCSQVVSISGVDTTAGCMASQGVVGAVPAAPRCSDRSRRAGQAAPLQEPC